MTKSQYTSTIVVTGGTLGLGYETALALATHFPSHQIIIASRSDKESAAKNINTATRQSNTIFLPLDLSSSESIKSFASTVTYNYPPITHLLLNAGLQFPAELGFYPNGIERTFQVNHLGHAQLFYLLLPHLTQTAHIIITASGTHDPAQKSGMADAIFPSAEEIARPNPQTANKDGRERYATSKLANVLWTYALARHARAAGKAWAVNAFDPGLLPGTGLAREYPPVLRWVWLHVFPRVFWLLRIMFKTDNIHTTQESGGSLARLAIGEVEGVKGVHGEYYEGRKAIKTSVMSYDEKKQEELWDWTVNYLAGEDQGLKAKWGRLEA